jgi:hypothetical protein
MTTLLHAELRDLRAARARDLAIKSSLDGTTPEITRRAIDRAVRNLSAACCTAFCDI